MPIYCSEWQGFSQTCHSCWPKTSRSKLLCFQSETHAEESRRASTTGLNGTHNQSVELGKAASQSSVLLLQQNQSGLNYRRRSLVKVDKRSDLVCKNQPIYTQVFRGIT